MVAIPEESSGTHVVFRLHLEPDLAKSRDAKRPIYDEYEVCDISFAGNKQTVGTFKAHDFADWGGKDAFGEREQRTYAMKYNAQYLAFKQGVAHSDGGTTLENAPFLTPNKRLELKAQHIYSVEALAGLDGNNLKMLGMGGRELKNQAIDFLAKQTAASGDVSAVVAENATLRARIEALEAARIAPLDHDGDGKMGGAHEPTTDLPDTPPAEDPWKTFENEDIIAWLGDSNVEFKDDKRWSDETRREKLVEQANEVLETQGKAKAAN